MSSPFPQTGLRLAAVCATAVAPVAFDWDDLNPLTWLGKGVSAAAGGVWRAAMIAVWSAGLWLLELAFKIIDAFTTPDLSADGPLATALPFTLAVGAVLALILGLVQIGVAALRRDGGSLVRVAVGLVQFGAVWVGYLAIAAALVTAVSGLTTAMLHGLLGVDSFSGYAAAAGWPRKVNDTVVATVLGLCTFLLVIPAAIGYVVIMLVRAAALLIIVATAPISAAGLLAESTRTWFWKSLRWFCACLMIAPLAALVLGIGVQLMNGVVHGKGDDTTAAVGTAVVGSILVLFGAVCPLVLFKLLAFVDPSTGSGAAMRAGFAAQGGLTGALSGSKASGGVGNTAASYSNGHGRSAGESVAGATTAGRFASATGGSGSAGGTAGKAGGGAGGTAGALGKAGAVAGGVATGVGVAATAATKAATGMAKVAHGAANVGGDVLGGTGVGHPHPHYGNAPTPRGRTASSAANGDHAGAGQESSRPDGAPAPGAAPPPTTGQPSVSPTPGTSNDSSDTAATGGTRSGPDPGTGGTSATGESTDHTQEHRP